MKNFRRIVASFLIVSFAITQVLPASAAVDAENKGNVSKAQIEKQLKEKINENKENAKAKKSVKSKFDINRFSPSEREILRSKGINSTDQNAESELKLPSIKSGLIGTKSEKDTVPGKIIVKYKDGVSSEQIKTMTTQIAAKKEKSFSKLGIDVLKVKATETKNKIKELIENENVEYAEPVYVVRALSIESQNDPAYTSSRQWGLTAINPTDLWADVSEADRENVTLAVIDTGVDMDHPDLEDNIVSGYDFINDDNNPDDDYGHGTHVAGIAAGISDNGTGIAGVASGIKIMPIKALDSDGAGTTETIVAGIDYAVGHNVDVINMSLGSDADSHALEDAVNDAVNAGVIVVAAAGNEYGSDVCYPAAYEGVIGVGAADYIDGHFEEADFSNVGPEVDVVAPGVDIYSTVPIELDNYNTNVGDLNEDGYALLSGTSMATPFVSGMAALLQAKAKANDNNLNSDEVCTILKDTAVDIGDVGIDNETGAGIINGDDEQELGSLEFHTIDIEASDEYFDVGDTIGFDINLGANRNTLDTETDIDTPLKLMMRKFSYDYFSFEWISEPEEVMDVNIANGNASINYQPINSGLYAFYVQGNDQYMMSNTSFIGVYKDTNSEISGTVSLPQHQVAPNGGLNIDVIAWNGENEFNENIIIPEGENSVDYAIGVDDPLETDVYEYYIEYDIKTQGVNDYVLHGFYGEDNTEAIEGNASIVEVTEFDNAENIDMVLIPGVAISGTIAVPYDCDADGVYIRALNADTSYYELKYVDLDQDTQNVSYNIVVPKTLKNWVPTFANINSDNNTPNDSEDDYNDSYLASLQINDEELTYLISYDFLGGEPDGFLNQGYYATNETVPNYNIANKVNIAQDTLSNINFEILTANTIRGNLSLPVGVLAEEEMDIYVDAIAEDGTVYTDNISIEEGHNAEAYKLNVTPGENYVVRYEIPDMEYWGGDYNEEYSYIGYYAGNESVSQEQYASQLDVENADISNINFHIIKNATIIGEISLPDGVDVQDVDLEGSIFANSGDFYSNAYYTIGSGETSAEFTLKVPPTEEGYYLAYTLDEFSPDLDIVGLGYYADSSSVTEFDSAVSIDVSSGNVSGINFKMLTIPELENDVSNTKNNAYELGLKTVYNESLDYGADIDYYKFTTDEAGIYIIKSTGETDVFCNLYKVVGDDLNLIATNDDASETNYNFRIEEELQADTTYYLKVTGYDCTTIGDYGIVVTDEPESLVSISGDITSNEAILDSEFSFEVPENEAGYKIFYSIPVGYNENYSSIGYYDEGGTVKAENQATLVIEEKDDIILTLLNNVKPEATEIGVSGTAKVGNTLTGSYIYYDEDGDVEGTTTFKWLSSSTVDGTYTAISGANAATYELKSSNKDKYIKFQVTPIAENGIKYGVATRSEALGPIEASSNSSSGGSGGGGGGSSSGGSTSTTTPNQETKTTESGKTTVNTGSDGKEVANIVVDSSKLSYDITSDKVDKVTINATTTSAVDNISVSIPTNVLDDASKATKPILIESNNVSLEIEPGTINTNDVTGDVVFGVSELSLKDVTGEISNTPSESDLVFAVFDFDLNVGGKNVTAFDKPITITVKFDITKVKDLDKVAVFYYNEVDNKWEYVGGKVNKNGTITFTVEHFSEYGVIENNKTFDDIQTHWAKKDIEFLAARQIVNGIDDKNFAPNKNVTRAQFVTMIAKALRLKNKENTNIFTDIDKNSYYKDAVNAAYSAGIVSGVGATWFSPDDLITREQMACIIVRAYAYKTGDNMDEIMTTMQLRYTDEGKVSSWARRNVILANVFELMNGNLNKTFAPQNNSTRAESAAVIKRLIVKLDL